MAPSAPRAEQRPRLLILTPDFPPAPGGIQVVAHRIAAGVERFRTRVLAPAAPGDAEFDASSGVDVRRVHGGARLRGGRNALLNAAALGEALNFRPDIVLSVHIVTSPASAAIRRALGARSVQYFHAEEIGAKPKLAAFAARQADRSIAVSAYTAGLVLATGAPAEPIRVIPNGTDLPAGAAAPETASEPPTFVTVARIEERYKGHDVIVRALPLVLAKVPDAQWVVIGDGTLRAGLESLARSYGVSGSIRFLGTVSEQERNDWLRRARLLVMPSRLPAGGFAGEGFGIVYLEAGAYGKPVVAGNVGGALDAVADAESGLLVDPTDPLLVAEAITRLLLDDPLARRLGEAGRGARTRRLGRSWWGALKSCCGSCCRRARRAGSGQRSQRRSGGWGRLKVLYVNHTATVSGGERSLLSLLGALPREVQPRLAAPRGRPRRRRRGHRRSAQLDRRDRREPAAASSAHPAGAGRDGAGRGPGARARRAATAQRSSTPTRSARGSSRARPTGRGSATSCTSATACRRDR